MSFGKVKAWCGGLSVTDCGSCVLLVSYMCLKYERGDFQGAHLGSVFLIVRSTPFGNHLTYMLVAVLWFVALQRIVSEARWIKLTSDTRLI